MNVAAIFVYLGSRAAISVIFKVKLEFGKQAEVMACVEIEVGHHAVHYVTVVVLRSLAKHPGVVILVLHAVLESEREIELRVVAQRNVLNGIEEVGALR